MGIGVGDLDSERILGKGWQIGDPSLDYLPKPSAGVRYMSIGITDSKDLTRALCLAVQTWPPAT